MPSGSGPVLRSEERVEGGRTLICEERARRLAGRRGEAILDFALVAGLERIREQVGRDLSAAIAREPVRADGTFQRWDIELPGEVAVVRGVLQLPVLVAEEAQGKMATSSALKVANRSG